MDEPIPEAEEKCLLKLLIPGPVAPMRKHKLEKLKVILMEFDPLYNPKQTLEASKRELPLNTIRFSARLYSFMFSHICGFRQWFWEEFFDGISQH